MKIRPEDSDLIRLLHGELSPEEERRLRARLGEDPGLEARYRRLSRAWDRLERPPISPVPELTDEVLARVRREKISVGWNSAPLWARVAAGVALPLGLVLGLIAASGAPPPGAEDSDLSAPGSAAYERTRDDGLADAYYELMMGGETEGTGTS